MKAGKPAKILVEVFAEELPNLLRRWLGGQKAKPGLGLRCTQVTRATLFWVAAAYNLKVAVRVGFEPIRLIENTEGIDSVMR